MSLLESAPTTHELPSKIATLTTEVVLDSSSAKAALLMYGLH